MEMIHQTSNQTQVCQRSVQQYNQQKKGRLLEQAAAFLTWTLCFKETSFGIFFKFRRAET